MKPPHLQCQINWIPQFTNIRKEHFGKVKNSNILQALSYRSALEPTSLQISKAALVLIDGHKAGYLQTVETRIAKGFLHFIVLDRGPLWFDGFGSAEHFDAFCTALRREFPRRPGRFMRFIPEIEDSKEIQNIMKAHDFRKKAPGYQTVWLDLNNDEETLRTNLKSNWRGHLRQAEKNGLSVEWDVEGCYLDWILRGYARDKSTKGYPGPSVQFMKRLAEICIKEKELLIGRALLDGKPIAGVLILFHGQSATYQIGFTSKLGREKSAHNFLLWQSLLYLKENGFSAFDLGGVNDDTAQGVKKFKTGLGGRCITLAGLYG